MVRRLSNGFGHLIRIGLAVALLGAVRAAPPPDAADLLAKADARWRAAVAMQPPDLAAQREARNDLLALLHSLDGPPLEGAELELWRTLRLSLGDSWWDHAGETSWGAAWSHYRAFLEAEARAPDFVRAGESYLGLLRRLSGPPRIDPEGARPGPPIPVEVLQDALRIATAPDDLARFHLHLALAWRDRAHGPAESIRTSAAFEAALREAAGTAWEPSALYGSALWMLRAGRIEEDSRGDLAFQPDPAAAIRLLDQIAPHADSHPELWEAAAELHARLTRPHLVLNSPDPVYPGEPAALGLEVANLDLIRLTAVPVTLGLRHLSNQPHALLGAAPPEVAGAIPVEVEVRPPQSPSHERWTLGVPDWPVLPPGAWLVTASAEDLQAQCLLLVTDLQVRILEAPDRLLAWVTRQGMAPIPVADAQVRLAGAGAEGIEARTGPDGLAVLPRPPLASGPWRAIAEHGGRIAASITPSAGKASATLLRPEAILPSQLRARPGDTVRWLAPDFALAADPMAATAWELRDLAGSRVAGGEFDPSTPGWLEARWEVPPGWRPGSLSLHSEGQIPPLAWLAVDPPADSLPSWSVDWDPILTEDPVPVRRWRVTVAWHTETSPPPRTRIPVELRLARDDRTQPRLSLESLPPPPSADADILWSGLLDLGRAGRGTAELELPPLALRSRVVLEARMPAGDGTHWVARHYGEVSPTGHSVLLETPAPLLPDGQAASITIRASDPDGNPVSVRGRLRLVHQSWTERWTDRDGRVVSGPPPAAERRPWWAIGGRGETTWRPLEPISRTEVLAQIDVTTGRDGLAVWESPPLQSGRHLLQWTSHDVGGVPITAQTEIWAVPDDAADLPFRSEPRLVVAGDGGEIQVLVLGSHTRTMPLLTVRQEDRWHHWHLVRAELGSHLVRLPNPDGPAWIDWWTADHANPVVSVPITAPEGTELTSKVHLAGGDDGLQVEVELGTSTPGAAAPFAWVALPHGGSSGNSTTPITSDPWPEQDASWRSPPLPLDPGTWTFAAIRQGPRGRVESAAVDIRVPQRTRPSWKLPRSIAPGDITMVTLLQPDSDVHVPTLTATLGDRPLTVQLLVREHAAGQISNRWQVSLPEMLPMPGATATLVSDHPDTTPATLPIAPPGRLAWAATAGRARDGDAWTVFPPPGMVTGRIVVRVSPDVAGVMRAAAWQIAATPAADPIHLVLQAVTPDRLHGLAALHSPSGARSPAAAAAMLRANQRPGGGWSPWQAGMADPHTTAAVLFFLRQAGDPAMADLEASAKSWLTALLAQPEIPPHTLAWMLAAIASPAPGPAAARPDPRILDAYIGLTGLVAELPPGAQAALALAALGLDFEDDARFILRRLPPPGWFEEPTSDGRWLRPIGPHPAGWPPTPQDLEEPACANALILLAVSLTGEQRPLGVAATASLLARREGPDWGSALGNGLALFALARGRETQPQPASAAGSWILEDSDGAVEITLDASAAETVRTLPWPLPDSPRTLTWRRSHGTGEPPFSLVAEWLPAGLNARPRHDGLTLERQLERQFLQRTLLRGDLPRREALLPQARIGTGDLVEAIYVLELASAEGAVVLTEHLPAGVMLVSSPEEGSPVALELRGDAAAGSQDEPERFTGRRRAVQFAPSLGPTAWVIEEVPAGRWEFRSLWQAVHPGTFTIPAAELAPLDDLPRPARSTASPVTIRD